MEDRHNIRAFLCQEEDEGCSVSLLAVYDGHGGPEVASLCARVLPDILHARLRAVDFKDWRTWRAVIADSIAELDARCVSEIRADDVGSTLCMCLFSYALGKVVTANLGDSRMVLLTDARTRVAALTVDHGSSCPREQERIAAQGGFVFPDEFGTPRVMGCLNLTRSVGDRHLRPFVSQQPDIAEYDLRRDDIILVASDGLWDVTDALEVRRAASFVAKKIENLPRLLTQNAMAKGSTDNITVAMAWHDERT